MLGKDDMKYDCRIMNGFQRQVVEADNIEEAQIAFVERLRENLATEHVEAFNMETDDGRDPLPVSNAEATD